MPFYGINQTPKYSSRVFHIAGTRVLLAERDFELPDPGRITQGDEPSGYSDCGTIVGGRVEINFEIPKEPINIGRIPAPIRYYMGTQSGSIRFSMQEYQPESIDIAAGGLGTPEAQTGYERVWIGGQLPPEQRILLLDDFDVSSDVDATQIWQQFQWTSPSVQGGGTFTRADEERAYVLPVEYNALVFVDGDYGRLMEFRAIEQV